MTTFRGRAFRAAIITSAFALTLAACSGSDDSTNDPTPTAAETSASEAATAQETTEAATTEAASGDDATAEFVDRFSNGLESMTTMSFTMEITSSGQTMSATGVTDSTVQPAKVLMEMTVPGAPAPVQSISIDGAQYINMGEAAGGMWMKMDASAQEGITGSGDPVEQLRAFQDAITEVQEVGTEDVNGAEATQYTVTIDSTKMQGQTDPAVTLPPVITYDIWLDGEGRTVKMVTDIESGGIQASTTLTFANFGEPVTIEAPPADQVTDAGSLG